MKIIQFLHGDQLGGMEKFCIDLSSELSKENEVMFIGDPAFKPLLNQKVRFQPIDINKKRNNPWFLWQLYKIISEFSPDIIHVHKRKSIDIMKRLAPFLKVPFVATKHDMQKKRSFHGLEYAISISDETSSTIKAKQIFKIYNGIPFIEPKKVDLPDTFNIVAVGGLRKVKGYDKLIAAVAELPFDFHLTIIGEGSERKRLEGRISELGLDTRVSLAGFKSNVNDYLYSADLQVIASESEGFSLSMIEGLFYAKMLISTKVSGCIEILPDELLFDIDELRDKMIDVYADQKKYQDIFNRVKEGNKEKLTIAVCAKKHREIYGHMIADYQKGTA
ncbi:MAG: glycosyltransferase [Sulfurimonas sp.]